MSSEAKSDPTESQGGSSGPTKPAGDSAAERISPPEVNANPLRKRLGTVFGWLAGGATGVLINYGLFLAVGASYPVIPSTFVLFVAGCLSGMKLADYLGVRAFRIMGVSAVVLLSLTVALFATAALSTANP